MPEPIPTKNVRPLTPKQQRFVEEYLIDLNGTQAAIRAGYTAKNADVVAHQDLLGNLRVAAAVQAGRQRLMEKSAISADRVIAEMARLAFSDLGDFVDVANGRVRVNDFTAKDGTRLDTRCISEISETVTESGGTIKIKLHNKQAALRDLGEHLGIFEPQVRGGLTLEAVAIHHPDGTTGLRVRATQAPVSSFDAAFDVVSE